MLGFALPEAQLYSAKVAGRNCIGPSAPAAFGFPAGGVSAVVGFDLADRGEQFPGHAELGGGLLVEGEVVGWDVGERGRARWSARLTPPMAAAMTSTGSRRQTGGGRERGCSCGRGELGRVAGGERMLGRAGEDAEGEAVVADDEEAVPRGQLSR